MIIVLKNNELRYKGNIYKCSLGKNGITMKKKEGDGCTPAGIFSLGSLYYRPDRIKKFKTLFDPIAITPQMFWSDYPESKYYNQMIRFKDISYESLYKKDNTYDIILVIKYNMNPVVKNRGSAIFLHVAKDNFSPTEGCVALEKKNFLHLLENLNIYEKIKIVF